MLIVRCARAELTPTWTMPIARTDSVSGPLCSQFDCVVTGEMFRIGGGAFGRYAIYGNRGIHDARLTAETVAARIDEARDMGDVELLRSTEHDMTRLGGQATLISSV